jgi:4-hydroxy-2-oxoheptanedioate aldolase
MFEVNKIKQKLNSGSTVFGTWSILGSTEAMMVMNSAKLDFIIIDMEHPPTNFETAQNQVFSIYGSNCTPILRLGDSSDADILRALELGSQSIMISHVSTVDEAEQIVNAAKYFPLGERGLSPFTVHHGYSDKNLKDKLIEANDQLFIGVLVEGELGINNLEEIARVDGIDMIYIGIYDISQVLGIPGDLTHKKVKKLLRDCVSVSEKNNKVAGSVARDKDYLSMMIDIGFRFISYKNDSFVLREGLEIAQLWYEEMCERK